MAGRTPEEAADNFVEFLRETLSCVSSQFLSAYRQSENLSKVYYDKYPKLITRQGGAYLMSVAQTFRIVHRPDDPNGPYKAKTREYIYRLLELTDGEREIVEYHWHPNSSSRIDFPHLHVPSAPKVHFPTSRVCLEDFVYMLIRDYDVKPKKKDEEWKRILNKNARAFEEMATWKIHPA